MDGERANPFKSRLAPNGTKKNGTKKPVARPVEFERQALRLAELTQHD